MLKVWIPGTTDVRDQGLGGTTWANSGVTIDSSGKLGKCLYSGTSGNMTTSNFSLSTKWSYSCWWKDANTSAGWQYIFLLYNGTQNDTNSQMAFLSYPTQSRCEVCSNGKWYSVQAYTPGTWNHIAATYDGTTCKVYFNGTYTTSFTPGQTVIGTNLQIFRGANVYLNDLRIWDDEVLSAKEIEIISRGLVCHYPLNRDGFGADNAIPGTYDFSGWNQTSTTKGGSISTESELYNGFTVKHIDARNDTGFLDIYKGGVTVNPEDVYTCTFYSKSNTGNGYAFFYNNSSNIVQVSSTTLDGVAVSTGGDGHVAITSSTTWQKHVITWTFNSGTTAGKTLLFRAHSGSDFYVCGVHLEKGSVSTPWIPATTDSLYSAMGLDSNVVHDVSGFGHNGAIVNGGITYSADTPKYNVSTEFDGVNGSIQVPFNDFVVDGDIFTLNLWWKKTGYDSKNYETLFGGPIGFEMDTRAGASTEWSLYMASTRGSALYYYPEINVWYMVTLVNDGTNELYYVNGELVKTITRKSMPSGNYFIGSWRDSTSQNYKGFISDFRIYKTALTGTQILELYNTAASLANNGTLFANEFTEV